MRISATYRTLFTLRNVGLLLVVPLVLAGCGSGSSSSTGATATIPTSGTGADNKVLFSSSNDTGHVQAQVYSVHADGTAIKRLTTDGSDDEAGAWSPDGTKVLFASNRDNGGGLTKSRDLYTMALDGTGIVRLTSDTTRNSVFGVWSPDGAHIAYSRAGQIATMNANGSSIVVVSGTDLANAINPVWSPDGAHIAFVADTPGAVVVTGGHSETIYVMSPDGTNRVALTGGKEYIHQVAWSPDGKTLVFDSSADTGGVNSLQTQIYVMKADGSNRVRLTNNAAEDTCPVWSPDGTRILFSSNRDHGGGSGGTNAYDLYSMAPDGSAVARLTTAGINPFVGPGGWKK